jgi:hypothetical protein
MTYIDDAIELADRLEAAGSPDDAQTIRQLINTLTAGLDIRSPDHALAHSLKPERKHAYTELPGHGLQNEGDSFHPDGTRTFHIAGRGHGLCSCGILSPELTSNHQRKAWHRQHKAAIKGATL